LRQFGVVLDRTGTRLALQFITVAPSGRAVLLPGGLRLAAEFGEVRVERAGAAAGEDRPLVVPAEPGSGAGEATVGGRSFRVEWTARPLDAGHPPGGARSGAFAPADLPLVVRGWRPGDRILTPGGTKTLKKLFVERRVPRSARARTPVVADAAGRVLWVVGVERARGPLPLPGGTAIFLSIIDD
ncbi:MAG TPA: tRNA lysidine(34) synthetase TilS, partial [Longimicrobiaceae bacterium]|nr:tRNA lysidine(34) synthetase TilS [Longimicrobiaceae bacterium]